MDSEAVRVSLQELLCIYRSVDLLHTSHVLMIRFKMESRGEGGNGPWT